MTHPCGASCSSVKATLYTVHALWVCLGSRVEGSLVAAIETAMVLLYRFVIAVKEDLVWYSP
jgi:hypothetical protein